MKHMLLVVLGAFLFISGITINLSLSGSLLWGEMEARLYISQSGVKDLQIECPLLIADWETAAVNTVITNSLANENTKPQINAYISNIRDVRVESTTLELAPLESQPLQWRVDHSDVVFDRLILINIVQRPYGNLASRQGACSILLFGLFGLGGHQTLVALVVAGVVCSLAGAGLLIHTHSPLTDFTKKIAQMNMIFLILVLAGLLSALPRFWGLTLIFDGAALLTFTVALTETLLFPKE